MILDCRVSGANDAAHRFERILLPKAWDIVSGVMHLHKRTSPGENVELLVLDYADAFYMLPLVDCEKRYFVAYFDGSF